MSSTVLVVDDIQSELDLICQFLVEEDFIIETANDGAEALEKVTLRKPDAIVTDWMMPVMGGIDLARKLKRNPNTADIPVVVCTVKDREVDRLWAAKQGVHNYVTKPYTKQDLINALMTAMK